MTSPAPSERTAFTTPTLLSLKELEETTNATYTTNVSTTPSTWIPLHTPYYLRTALLLLVTATSATVAFSGIVVLGYLLATHSLTPRQLWYSNPLQLDLTGRELVSVASMLPLTHGNSGGGGSGMLSTAPAVAKTTTVGDLKIHKSSRFLPPGQRMDVWLDFVVPALDDGSREAGELAYVVADIETVDGKSAARSTQPVVLKSHSSATLWRFLTAPLHWTGLLSDARVVSVKVFSNYIERRDLPFATFKLKIKSRNDASPKILSATVRVHLRVGFIRRVLYHLRPHSLIALSMGAGAACAIVGGSIGAALCIAVLVYTIILRSRQEGGGGEEGERGGNKRRRRFGSVSGSDNRPGSSLGSDLSSEIGSELFAGMSSAGTTPRHLDLDEEYEGREAEAVGGGRSPAGASETVSPSSSPSPKEEKSWQVLLKQIPFPSPRHRPATGDDTPYIGGSRVENSSDVGVGGLGSGRTELGAAGLRYRGGEAARNDS